MTFLYEVYRLITENIKTKSLFKTNYNKMRVSLGSLWCGKQNHFEAVCRSKNPNKRNQPKNQKRDVQNLVDENSSSEESDDIAYTFSVNSTSNEQSQPMFKIIVHDTTITIMADSGASVNVLDERDYRVLTNRPMLKQTKVRIHPYKSSKPLTVLGKFTTT